MRILQHTSGKADEIRIAIRNDFLRMLRAKDHSNRHYGQTRPCFHGAGKLDLVTFANRYFLLERQAAAGNRSVIAAECFKPATKFRRFVNIPAAFQIVGGGKSNSDRFVFGPGVADRPKYLDAEACPVLKAATPTVFATVRAR